MKAYVYRYWWFVCGLIINSFGIAVVIHGALGTTPISSLPFVLSSQFAPTLGQFTFIVNSCFILMQILLLRRKFNPIQLLQVFANILFSTFLDISMSFLSWLHSDFLPVQIAIVVVGCIIMALGISIEVAPNVLLVPGEGFVKAVSTVTGWRFGSVKVAFDSSLVALSAVLSLFFVHQIIGLGIGTLITAFSVGRFVNLFNKTLPFIPLIAGIGKEETPQPVEA